MSKPSPLDIQFPTCKWDLWILDYPWWDGHEGRALWVLRHPMLAYMPPGGDPSTEKEYRMCGVLLYLLGGPEKGIIPREIIPKLPSLQSKVEGILKEESRQRKLSEDSNPFPPEPKGKSLKKECRQPKSAHSAPSSPEPRGMSQVSPTPRNEVREPLLTWEEWERRALEEENVPKRKTPGVKKVPKRKTPGVKKVPKRKTPGEKNKSPLGRVGNPMGTKRGTVQKGRPPDPSKGKPRGRHAGRPPDPSKGLKLGI